jgi:DNA-binding NarL/FixJ family response regulator
VAGFVRYQPEEPQQSYRGQVTTSADGAATVLIVDDHPIMRRGLGMLLKTEPWVGRVLEAGDANEAARLAVTEHPGVAIVDLNLGVSDHDGIELIRRLRHTAPDCSILVLTMTQDDAVVRTCLAAGASGYVLKGSSPQGVVSAVLTVAEGGLVLGPRVSSEGLMESSHRALPAPLDRLTPRDVELLALLGEGASNRQIARTLAISEKTVRNRLTGIFSTLGVADRVQAALLARDKGLTTSRSS